MTRLRILALAMFCLGLGAFLLPALAPMTGGAQPAKGDGEAERAKQARLRKDRDALKRLAELRSKLETLEREQRQLLYGEGDRKDDDEQPRPAEKKIDPEQRARRARAIEVELREARTAYVAALRDAPSAESREENRLILRMLQEPVETRALVEKVKLRSALEYLSDRFNGQLAMIVDRAAFFASHGADAPDLYEEEVYLAPIPQKMTLGTALRLLLSQVGKGEATFVIRQGYIEITTLKASSAAHVLRRPMVLASFEGRPLWEVLENLSDESGLAIHLDSNIPKKIQAITAKFYNSSLEDALVTVTEMTELKFVVMERSVFVTTPEKAVILRKEEAQRAIERRDLRPMPKDLDKQPARRQEGV